MNEDCSWMEDEELLVYAQLQKDKHPIIGELANRLETLLAYTEDLEDRLEQCQHQKGD